MDVYESLEKLTFPDLVAALAQQDDALEAVVGPEGRVTFRQLYENSSRLARAMVEWGLRPGDRLGVHLPNGVRWITGMLAGHLAGAHVVPINTWYRSSELSHLINKANIRLILSDSEIFGRPVEPDFLAADWEVVLKPGEELLGTVFWSDELPIPLEAEPFLKGDDSPLPGAKPEEIALILFTSGSTADPKAVPLRHDSILINAREIGKRQRLRPKDRLWFALPLFFGYGCENALPAAWTHGATLCLEERATGDDSLAFLERERCTVYYGLPAMTRMLLNAPSFGKRDISLLRTGTTSFTAEDKRLVIEELGVTDVCSVYGLTEAYGHSAMTEAGDPLDVVLHTQGRVLPTQEIRIVGQTHVPLPANEIGEIQLRGRVTDGYLDSPELNEAAFTPDGWFRTGDLGSLDGEGRLRFAGRLKEMMKVKGINVSPAEIEQLVSGHPKVDQAYVFGVPDLMGEEAIGCVVVPFNTTEDVGSLINDIHDYVRVKAANYKTPAQYQFLRNDEIPTTDTGKVNKRTLQETFVPVNLLV